MRHTQSQWALAPPVRRGHRGHRGQRQASADTRQRPHSHTMARLPNLAFRLPIPCQGVLQQCDYKIFFAMKTPHDYTPPVRLWDRGAAHVEERILVLQPIRTTEETNIRVFTASVGNLYSEARVNNKSYTADRNMLRTEVGDLCWPSAQKFQTASAEELRRMTTWKGRQLSPCEVPSDIQILCYGEHHEGGRGNACRVLPLVH